MDISIIKLGGSAITDKSEKFSLKEEILDQIATELASVKESFVLVHGGGSFGHPVAEEYDISSGYSEEDQLMGFSKTHQAMEELNSKIVEALIKAGKPAVPVQTSACILVEDDEIVSMEIQNIRKLLDLGVVPVLYGDCVLDSEKGMTILSGDQLTAFLARKLEASEVILGADVNGVYTENPKESEDAKLISEITPETWEGISLSVDFSSQTDVTGGMKNKIEVFLELAKEEGIESKIVNATKPGILKQAIGSDIEVDTKIMEG